MLIGRFRRSVFLSAILLGCIAPTILTADESDSSIDQLVAQLDSPSYHTRSGASRKLIRAATADSDGGADRVARALRRGKLQSVEARLAAIEIERSVRQIQRDREIERLLNPRNPAAAIRLDGWTKFVASAGDDMAARRMFARLMRRYPDVLERLAAGAKLDDQRVDLLDPYDLSAEDAAGWAMLLTLDRELTDPKSTLSTKIAIMLGNSATGPSIPVRRDAEVVRRLIDRWLRDPHVDVAMRERLVIAMRYQCHESADLICDRIFSDHHVPASTRVTALLCAAALRRGDLESQARRWLDDNRTAHVWQLLPSRPTRIRTQVADVALAVLMHHRGIDPRKAGYVELQADTTLVFRDHSLGFIDEPSRRAAYESAWHLLATTPRP